MTPANGPAGARTHTRARVRAVPVEYNLGAMSDDICELFDRVAKLEEADRDE